MSEEQLASLLAKLKDDAALSEKLQGAADLDAALALAKEAGFDVSKDAWLRYQANQTEKLSDEELVGLSGGTIFRMNFNGLGGLVGENAAANAASRKGGSGHSGSKKDH